MKKRTQQLMAVMLTTGLVFGMDATAFAKPKVPVTTTETVVEETVVGETAEGETAEETTSKKGTAGKKEKKQKVESQKVSKVTCTAAGKINVSFRNKVTYTDALSAVIIDAEGNEIPCKISKKKKNLLTVSVSGLINGQKYILKVEGILAKDSTEIATVTKEFTAKGMKTQCKVGNVTVKKNVVTLKMKSSADYKDAEVIAKDADGNLCEAKIVKKAKGNIKIQVSNMEKGKTYTVTVNGVKTKKEKNFSSVSKTFTVK